MSSGSKISKKLSANLPTNSRAVAAQIINQVIAGQSLTACLENQLDLLTNVSDRAFVQAICYGVCRFYTRLSASYLEMINKPLKAKDQDIYALILVGLYQLIEMRVPAHAAVAETVNAAQELGKPWARGLINAILRHYLRECQKINEKINLIREVYHAHPAWWIDTIQNAWPDDWEAILKANNTHPPFSLRVNQQHLSREQYLNQCHVQTFSAQSILETRQGVIFESALSIHELPGFVGGDVSVQDGASQLASELMVLKPHLRVLDACAAPGGKLCHMLETESHLTMIGVEKDPARIISMKENLTRLNLHATCICEDVGAVNKWWDGKLFDRILLDAPCSASGVIRRHPDIKILRQYHDINVLAKEQKRLLNSLWPLLKPNGLLLYVTCSIFPEENVEVIQSFLRLQKNAVADRIFANWGIALTIGRQILPGQHNMDGFYYARLRKMDH